MPCRKPKGINCDFLRIFYLAEHACGLKGSERQGLDAPDILVLGDLAAQRDTSSPYGAMVINWPSFGWLFGVFPRCRGTVLWRTMRCSSPAGIKTNLDDRSIFSAVAPGRNLWSGCIIVPRFTSWAVIVTSGPGCRTGTSPLAYTTAGITQRSRARMWPLSRCRTWVLGWLADQHRKVQ